MDDLSGKISALLNDPEGMARFQKMAESLLNEPKNEPETNGLDISKLIPIISKINSAPQDNRVALLEALRPHLSEPRKARLDSAVKLLRAASFLPLLGESGLFDL